MYEFDGSELDIATVDQKRRTWWTDRVINFCFIASWCVNDVHCSMLVGGTVDPPHPLHPDFSLPRSSPSTINGCSPPTTLRSHTALCHIRSSNCTLNPNYLAQDNDGDGYWPINSPSISSPFRFTVRPILYSRVSLGRTDAPISHVQVLVAGLRALLRLSFASKYSHGASYSWSLSSPLVSLSW